jgi:acyl-CoA synthetase (AMP-forming)/AMP-acid ligase II
MDEDGYIYLGGRADDLIIRGGENISPQEVEEAIYSHPAVDEVAVVGVDDLEWGQVPRAVVVLKKGAQATDEEIMEHCRSRLASFKRPRSVVFVDALPHSAVGKMLRKEVRKIYGQS